MVKRLFGSTAHVCALVVIGCGVLHAATVAWSDEVKGFWLKNESGIALASDEADAPSDLQLSGRELIGTSVTLLTLAGGEDEFAALSEVPDTGYGARVSLDAGRIVVARLADGRHAKLLINAATYNPESPSPNANGVQVTAVLSR